MQWTTLENVPGVAQLAFRGRGVAAPLAQVVAFLVEDDDALVAVAVGDIDIAVVGVDDSAGRAVQAIAALVRKVAFLQAVSVSNRCLVPICRSSSPSWL